MTHNTFSIKMYSQIKKVMTMFKVNLHDKFTNKYGQFEIANYISSRKVLIRWIDQYSHEAWTTSSNILKGNVKNPYFPSVYGVGFVGTGIYRCQDNIGMLTREYRTWSRMLERCYSKNSKTNHPSYSEITVTLSWHNFQVFAKWFCDHPFYECDYELDKDILVKGNKVYGPDTCTLVPKRINTLLLSCKVSRGQLPIGVCKSRGKYSVFCRNFSDERVWLGYFNTVEAAFNSYKIFKESVIKQIAVNLKDKIEPKVYDVLMDYKVEITD